MLKITIHSLEDFNSLRNINPQVSLFLHFASSFPKEKIKAIDMKNFKSSIYLSFDEPNVRKRFSIYTNQKKKFAFFENIDPKQITFLSKANVEFQYHSLEEIKSVQKVSNEKELLKAIQEYLKNPNTYISFTKDIVVTKALSELFHAIPCVSNGNILYSKVENPINHPNIKNCIVDGIIHISSVQDFYSLENLTQGTFVVQISNNLRNFALKAISLENFTGTLYILGNSHKLKDGMILANKEGVGLISCLHPYTNIFIRDLSLAHITFEESKFNGGFIGYRKEIKNKFCSPPGKILLQNCMLSDSCFKGETITPFMGQMSENMEIDSSTFHNIKTKTQILNYGDGSSLSIPNSFDKTYSSLSLRKNKRS